MIRKKFLSREGRVMRKFAIVDRSLVIYIDSTESYFRFMVMLLGALAKLLKAFEC